MARCARISLGPAGVLAILAAWALTACGGPAATPSVSWRVLDPDAAGDGGPLSATVVGDRFVGVGFDRVWTSDDGRAWQGIVLAGDGDVRVSGLAGHDGRLVATGSVATGPAVWLSEDAESWRRAPDDPDLDAVPGFESLGMERVAVGAHGFVAVGTEWGDAGQRPVTWRSADGVDWTRSEEAPTGSGPRDIAAFADGYVMAVADDARSGEMTRAGFWWSDDGLTWSAAAGDGSYGNAEPQSLAVHGDTIVATGYRITQDGFAPMVWVSSDGRTWEPVRATPALGWWPLPGPTPVQGQGALQGTMMSDVAAGPDGLVAVGVHWGLDPARQRPDGSYPMAISAAVWRSTDGRAWELLSADPSFALGESESFGYGLTGALAVEGRVLAFGNSAQFGATVWEGSFPAG